MAFLDHKLLGPREQLHLVILSKCTDRFSISRHYIEVWKGPWEALSLLPGGTILTRFFQKTSKFRDSILSIHFSPLPCTLLWASVELYKLCLQNLACAPDPRFELLGYDMVLRGCLARALGLIATLFYSCLDAWPFWLSVSFTGSGRIKWVSVISKWLRPGRYEMTLGFLLIS